MERCTIVYESEQKSVFCHGSFFSFSVSTPDHPSIVRVHSKLGPVNPLCSYNFGGTLGEGSIFRATSYEMSPVPISLSSLKTIGKLLFECTEKAINTAFWFETVEKWEASANRSMVYVETIQPIIEAYIRYIPTLAFWVNPEPYKIIQKYYQNNSVFGWSMRTCEVVLKALEQDPFQLCFSTPCSDMKGSCLEIDNVVAIHPINKSNELSHRVAVAAEPFCWEPLQKVAVGDFEPDVLAQLIERGFVRQINGWIVNAKTFAMVSDLTGLEIIITENSQELNKWCHQHSEYTFLAPAGVLIDNSRTAVLRTVPKQFQKLCLMNLELWTLGNIHTLVSKFGLSKICGIGFTSSIGNRLNYNPIHYLAPIPTPFVHDVQVLPISDLERLATKKCVVVKVGSNVFRTEILQKLRQTIKQFANKKVSFVTNVALHSVPYSFRTRFRQRRHLFKTKDRVVLEKSFLLFVKTILETSANKRKRIETTEEHISYKRRKGCMIVLGEREPVEFKTIKNEIELHGLTHYSNTLGLQDDIIVLFNVGAIDPLVLHSLSLAAKRVFAIVSDTERIDNRCNFDIPDFLNINK